jgi:tetratricopeptide (TPR) repeat protein
VSGEVPDHALRRLLSDSEPLLEELGRVPERLGKYRIVRLIGRGGMGVVYEAFDEELKRPVALKLLEGAAASNAALRERMLREARSAARLGHPNIAAVYDAGEGWIAMRLVAGSALHLAPPADVATRVRRIRDAALAVHHAHEAGIVHRDLKPHNLLLEGERIFVTDFGLAKELAVDSSLSLSGHVLGSPSYMAPEQAQGRVHAIDARTDVFGLGATLFHLLAGRPPFMEEDIVQLLRRIVEDEPPSLTTLAADVPRDLETIVLKCLEKDPARRYPSALALAEDLERWLDGEPVLARRPSLAYRAGKFARRHRALVLLSSASALALAVLGAAAWKERAAKNASTSALDLATLVQNVLDDDDRYRQAQQLEEGAGRLEEGVAACEAFLARNDVGRAHLLLGKLLRRSGKSDRAKRSLDRALELDPGLAEARLERGLLVGRAFMEACDQLDPPTAARPPELEAMKAEALADLDAAIRESHQLSTVGSRLARVQRFLVQSDIKRARTELVDLERIAPSNPDMFLARGRLEREEGDPAAAWKSAMSYVDVMNGLGPAYAAKPATKRITAESLRLDDVEGELVDFTKALNDESNSANLWANRSFMRARQAARLSGEEKLDDALEAWASAIADATTAITHDASLSGTWNNRGVCRMEHEKLLRQRAKSDEATAERRVAGTDFDEAVRLDPRSALIRLNRARQRRRDAGIAVDAKTWPQAEAAILTAGEDANVALRSRASDPAAWLERAQIEGLEASLFAVRGDVSAAKHSNELARADYDMAVGLSSEDKRALALRGLHRATTDDVDGARSDLEVAIAGPLDRDLKARVVAELAKHRRQDHPITTPRSGHLRVRQTSRASLAAPDPVTMRRPATFTQRYQIQYISMSPA